jgi:hypothetical protein
MSVAAASKWCPDDGRTAPICRYALNQRTERAHRMSPDDRRRARHIGTSGAGRWSVRHLVPQHILPVLVRTRYHTGGNVDVPRAAVSLPAGTGREVAEASLDKMRPRDLAGGQPRRVRGQGADYRDGPASLLDPMGEAVARSALCTLACSHHKHTSKSVRSALPFPNAWMGSRSSASMM